MKLRCEGAGTEYDFSHVALVFDGTPYQDAFSQKNNKTVLETLKHKRYAKLKNEVLTKYPESLEKPLGLFLLELKRRKDVFYERFLNRYGDLIYSQFRIENSSFLDSRGVYAYLVEDELKYIGRCKDSMRKRINQGYGKIYPKNCYVDGQTTNCHLNARIAAERNEVTLWFHEMELEEEIESLEKALIREFQPPWNIQRG